MHLHALPGVPVPTRESVSKETGEYWDLCEQKLGLVPNVIRAYSFDDEKLNAFTRMYNLLMLGPSGLSKLEREMIAVVVSSVNRCFYCLVAHGAAVRQLSDDPVLGELIAMNYRTAELDKRQRAMLDFAWKLAETPAEIEESDRQSLARGRVQRSRYLGHRQRHRVLLDVEPDVERDRSAAQPRIPQPSSLAHLHESGDVRTVQRRHRPSTSTSSRSQWKRCSVSPGRDSTTVPLTTPGSTNSPSSSTNE